jgi:hypothetical protein
MISHFKLGGFNATGAPWWVLPPALFSIPSSIQPLGRIQYIQETDTMVLSQALAADWTTPAGRVEVYHGWMSGNTHTPSLVFDITAKNPKALAVAGQYLFVGYVHTVPNIDAFNLKTGKVDITLVDASTPDKVYVGNDVDSMYGLQAYKTDTGEYIVTKDNYNGASITVHTVSGLD